jgi:hypothetical protein
MSKDYLKAPFYPNHPQGHAPRGHPKAQLIGSPPVKCPKCGSVLITADGWIWCFNHDHSPTEPDPASVMEIWYVCDFEAKIQ